MVRVVSSMFVKFNFLNIIILCCLTFLGLKQNSQYYNDYITVYNVS